jgi:hypothetical protein
VSEFCGVETFDALADSSRQVSRSAQMQALRVSPQITKQISLSISCCLARRAVACLMGLYANDCTFNSNSIAQSRFEIVNPAA